MPVRLVVVKMNRRERGGCGHVLHDHLLQEIRLAPGGSDHEPFLHKPVVGPQTEMQANLQAARREFELRLAAAVLDCPRVLRAHCARVGRDGEANARHLICQLPLLVADAADTAGLRVDIDGDVGVFESQRFRG